MVSVSVEMWRVDTHEMQVEIHVGTRFTVIVICAIYYVFSHVLLPVIHFIFTAGISLGFQL